MTKKGLDRLQSRTVCTAKRRNGSQCLNYAIKGATVCRMHGGSAPQVRRAAQVRLLMSADNLMAALLKIALDEKQPVQARLIAIRDGLDRANLAGTQNVEVTVERGKTFEDFVGEAIVDLTDDDYGDYPEIEDAVVVDDEPPLRNRHDRAAFREADRAKQTPHGPLRLPPTADYEAARREQAAEPEDDEPEDAVGAHMTREQILLAKQAGTYNPSSRGTARDTTRRARSSRAKFD